MCKEVCYDYFDCSLCTALSDAEELDTEFPEKDRSVSRRRHLNGLKAKKRAKKASAILDAKFRKLSAYATFEEEHRANMRTFRASKKVERLLPKSVRYASKEETAWQTVILDLPLTWKALLSRFYFENKKISIII